MPDIVRHGYRSDRRLSRALKTSRDIEAQLRRISPDVVVLHSSFPGLWGRLHTGLRPWKTLYCAHGWAFEQRTSSMKRVLYGTVESLLSRRTDAIVSISASEYQAAERLGVRPRSHKLIRHGLAPASGDSAMDLPISPEHINLLFIGRFDRQKGLDLLLEALDDPRLAHVTLWVVGRNIIGEGVAVPARPNIRLLGWLENEKIDGVIRQMDAVVAPSRWEGFGLVALEAMRNGRPAIVSPAGGLKELIEDGVNGRLLDITHVEAMRDVLASLRKPDLERMGQAGLAIFQQKHGWDRCYGEWQTLISGLGSS